MIIEIVFDFGNDYRVVLTPSDARKAWEQLNDLFKDTSKIPYPDLSKWATYEESWNPNCIKAGEVGTSPVREEESGKTLREKEGF